MTLNIEIINHTKNQLKKTFPQLKQIDSLRYELLKEIHSKFNSFYEKWVKASKQPGNKQVNDFLQVVEYQIEFGMIIRALTKCDKELTDAQVDVLKQQFEEGIFDYSLEPFLSLSYELVKAIQGMEKYYLIFGKIDASTKKLKSQKVLPENSNNEATLDLENFALNKIDSVKTNLYTAFWKKRSQDIKNKVLLDKSQLKAKHIHSDIKYLLGAVEQFNFEVIYQYYCHGSQAENMFPVLELIINRVCDVENLISNENRNKYSELLNEWLAKGMPVNFPALDDADVYTLLYRDLKPKCIQPWQIWRIVNVLKDLNKHGLLPIYITENNENLILEITRELKELLQNKAIMRDDEAVTEILNQTDLNHVQNDKKLTNFLAQLLCKDFAAIPPLMKMDLVKFVRANYSCTTTKFYLQSEREKDAESCINMMFIESIVSDNTFEILKKFTTEGKIFASDKSINETLKSAGEFSLKAQEYVNKFTNLDFLNNMNEEEKQNFQIESQELYLKSLEYIKTMDLLIGDLFKDSKHVKTQEDDTVDIATRTVSTLTAFFSRLKEYQTFVKINEIMPYDETVTIKLTNQNDLNINESIENGDQNDGNILAEDSVLAGEQSCISSE